MLKKSEKRINVEQSKAVTGALLIKKVSISNANATEVKSYFFEKILT